MSDDDRAKALKLCREWWKRRNDKQTHQIEGSTLDDCIAELAQMFGITWVEVARKEKADA